MRKILSVLAVGATAAALAIGPTAAATAAPHATASHGYTLSITGNGTTATVSYIALAPKATKAAPHVVKSAHLPWKKSVTAKAELYTISATSKTGTRIGCTIKDNHGKVLSTSTAYGKHGIVTCIVAKGALGSALGGGSGSGSGSSGGSGSGS